MCLSKIIETNQSQEETNQSQEDYTNMTFKKILSVAIIALATVTVAFAQEKQPAFPGAEGYGRYTTGGRGGKVYYVTNLNDSGEGSLRWALNQAGKRTIMFKVSGTIFLKSALSVNIGDVTIAGQSAPGDGICVADYPFTINANNVIMRYMRFRLGQREVAHHEGDGLGAMDHENIIIDHCSVSWSIDECLSVLGNKNTTVQWCISSHSLVNAGHEKGAHGYGGNWGGDHASFHHNLMIHHVSRTPRLGPRQTTQEHEHMDMRNNVFYNWAGNGCYGGEGMDVNIVNNYYKPGPGTPDKAVAYRLAGIGIRTTEYCKDSNGNWNDWYPMWHKWGHLFVEGNVNPKYSNVTNDNWTYGIYAQIDASGNDGTYTEKTKDTIRLSAPIDFIYTTTHSAADAYARVLDYVGCSLSRDSYDNELISDARNGKASHTGSGLSSGFINTQDDLKPSNADSSWSPWPTLNSTTAPTDSDGDGMPDTWESANGLNSTDASDGALVREDGYTNLEYYLNSLVASITEAQNAGGTVEGGIIEKATSDTSEYEDVATGTITWSVPQGTNSTTFLNELTVSAELQNYVTGSKVTKGSNLTLSSTCNRYSTGPLTGDQYLLRIGYSSKSTDESGINDLTYEVTPVDGYLFMPTAVSVLVNKVGTDGGNAKVILANDGVEEILYNGSPSRNEVNADKGYNNYTYVDAQAENPHASANSSKAIVRLTSFDTSKQMSVGTLSITGKVVTAASTAVNTVQAESSNKQDNVYSIDGRLLIKNVTKNQIGSLPKGIYIIDGKKVAVW